MTRVVVTGAPRSPTLGQSARQLFQNRAELATQIRDRARAMLADRTVLMLVAGMLISGTANTILTKYQVMQCVENCDGPAPERRVFEQPVLQTLQMFIGEMGCWLPVLVSRFRGRGKKDNRAEYEAVPTEETPLTEPQGAAADVPEPSATEKFWPRLLVAIPAALDCTGTTLMNVGLLFVAASVYQMTRGSLPIFVAAISILVMGQKVSSRSWLALLTIMAGVAIVGLSSVVYSHKPIVPSPGDPLGPPIVPEKPELLIGRFDTINLLTLAPRAVPSIGAQADPLADAKSAIQVLTGVFCILIAQIFSATQYNTELYLQQKYSYTSFELVGWEGFWGTTITLFAMFFGYIFYGATDAGQGSYFDVVTGMKQLFGNEVLLVTSGFVMLSIAVFNYTGLSFSGVKGSPVGRSVIDTCRTLFIWIVSLSLGWETFNFLQATGFVVLVAGTLSYVYINSAQEKPDQEDDSSVDV